MEFKMFSEFGQHRIGGKPSLGQENPIYFLQRSQVDN